MVIKIARFGSKVSMLWAVASCLLASALIQLDGSTGEAQGAKQIAAMPSSDFEVKIVKGEFFVRQKGTQDWKRSLTLSDPVAVGLVDGDHKIYVPTKAIKPPKAFHME